MHYQKTFLSKVILRLDFDPIDALANSTAQPKFSEQIAARYPVVVGKPLAQFSVSITPEGPGVAQQANGMQWDHFKKADGTVFCSLAPQHFTLEYGHGDYKNFNDFFEDLTFLVGAFLKNYQVPQIGRLGLRYINEIDFPAGNALDWDNLINPNLINSAKAALIPNYSLVRAMQQYVGRKGDDIVVFHYGFFNPDYPNPLVRREFILDFDCSRAGAVATGEVLNATQALNGMAEEFFEYSIADGLRQEMGIL